MPLGQDAFNVEPLPFWSSGYGVKTPFGMILPPGGRVAAYVRGTAAAAGGATLQQADLDDPFIAGKLVPTISAGLALCRANRNDVVVVLEGHTENVVDSATALTGLIGLKAGATIIGSGWGSNMPTVRWTNTAGSWLLNQNDVRIFGLRLRMEGANGITRAINVTGADCLIAGCDIEVASGATNKAAVGIELTNASAARFRFMGNKVRGTLTHNVTNFLLLSAAVDQCEITRNVMFASATAANGLVNITAAAINCYIAWNTIYNTMTASTAAINVGNVAADGIIEYCNTGVLNNGVAANQGVVLGAASTFKCAQSFTSDEPNKSGALSPAAVAT